MRTDNNQHITTNQTTYEKFLLSLAALVLAGASAIAKEYTITFSELDKFKDVTSSLGEKTMTISAEGFNIVIDKNSGSTNPTYYKNGNAIRIYAKNQLTITAPAGVNITALSGDAGTYNSSATITADSGTVTASPFTWSGTANEIVMTLGSSGQLRLISLTITTDESEGPAKKDAGLAFEQSEITVPFSNDALVNPLTKATDAEVVYTSSDETIAKVTDAAKGIIQLQGGFGTTTITATTAETAEYKAGEASFTLTVTDPAAKRDANLKFAEAIILGEIGTGKDVPTNELTKDTDGAVTYSSSDENVATVDATTGALTLIGDGTTVITAKSEETTLYAAGEATYTLVVSDKSSIVYEHTCLTEDCGFTFETSTSSEVEPWKIDSRYGLKASAYISGAAKASDAYAVSPVLDLTSRIAPIELTYEHAVNMFKLNGASIDVAEVVNYVEVAVREEGATEWTKLADITVPEKFSWNFYEDGANLDAYAGKKIQIGFHYTSTAEIAGTWEIVNVKVTGKTKSAIPDITAEDTDAPVVYYNLQGVRVENPANGLYIRVQGNKSTKVLIR